MITHSYFFRVRPTQLHAQTRGWPTLEGTAQAFASTIDGGEIRPLAATDDGNHDLELRLRRDENVDADKHVRVFNHIFIAAQNLGYVVLQAEVRNVVTASVDYAIKGALGGGGVGGLSTKNPYVTLAGMLFGAVVGHAAGEAVEQIKVVYEVRSDRAGRWWLAPTPQPQARVLPQPA